MPKVSRRSAFRFPLFVAACVCFVALSLGLTVGANGEDSVASPATSASSVTSAGSATPKLVIVSWDGAADWVIDRWLDQGKLPNLAALAARGIAADHSVPPFPSKTAVSHATLWTGAFPGSTGVYGNSAARLPRHEHTVMESQRGFSSDVLRAEPLFYTAAAAGRTVVVLSATHVFPADRYSEALGARSSDLRSFSGFEHAVAPGRMWREDVFEEASSSSSLDVRERRGRIEIADSTFELRSFDDPDDPVSGFDTVEIREAMEPGRVLGRLKPREASPRGGAGGQESLGREAWGEPVVVRSDKLSANTFFRLYSLAPDGSSMELYQRAANDLGGAHTAGEKLAYQQAYPGFHDDPFRLYSIGAFGPPLAVGGEGMAEDRVLELVAFDVDLLISGTEFAFEAWDPDVLFHYSPMLDSAGHTWVGSLDPRSPRHEPEMAARLWPYYTAVAAELDRWLGALVAAAGEERVVALVADHGMMGTGERLHVNNLLEEAGLLVRDDGGRIDLAKSQAVVPRFGSFMAVVNSTEWRSGIVPPESKEAVLARLEKALLDARHPQTGAPLIERIFRPAEYEALGLGGEGSGDIYFDTAYGLYPDSRFGETAVEAMRPSWGQGNHGFWPERRSMHAIFYAAGPGLAEGRRVPPIRHIDVAPTLARVLGIPAPADSVGLVIGQALAGSAPMGLETAAAPEEQR